MPVTLSRRSVKAMDALRGDLCKHVIFSQLFSVSAQVNRQMCEIRVVDHVEKSRHHPHTRSSIDFESVGFLIALDEVPAYCCPT